MNVKIIDTTLRDGEQQAGIALRKEQKKKIAGMLSELGIAQIEAGTPAMLGEELESVKAIAAMGLSSKISAWNRMNTEDVKASVECGVDVIHISAPVSEIQIALKLNKDPEWVLEKLEETVRFAVNQKFAVHVGMEDASRADIFFMEKVCAVALQAGASMVRYADTVGVLRPSTIKKDIAILKSRVPVKLGIHTHNDLGLALSNTLSAAQAGVSYVDTTIGGIGERAGNCNFRHFIEQSERYNIKTDIIKDVKKIKEYEQLILHELF